MKFCRLLRTTSEDLPEMHGIWVFYKQLKKQLNRAKDFLEQGNVEGWHQQEILFVEALNTTLRQLNDTFLEREEHLVIQLDELESQARRVGDRDRCQEVIRRFIDFHGEILLLMHWSMLAYTSLVKILKKHLKKTGHSVQGWERGDLGAQPISSTEVSSSVVQRAEGAIQQLNHLYRTFENPANPQAPDYHPQTSASTATNVLPLDTASQPDAGETVWIGDQPVDIYHRTRVALNTWEQLTHGAITPSTVLDLRLWGRGNSVTDSASMDSDFSAC